MTDLDNVLKSSSITLLTKVCVVKKVFFSSHVWMWELDHTEGWALKNWCFWIVVLEKTLESPLECKEIQSINLKGNHPWIFIGRTDVETKAPILWPPKGKSRLIRKDPDAGKNWGQEEKEATADVMVEWHHWLKGMRLSQLLEIVKDRKTWHEAVHEVTKSQTGLSDWITTTKSNWMIDLHWFFP